MIEFKSVNKHCLTQKEGVIFKAAYSIFIHREMCVQPPCLSEYLLED